LQKTFGTKEEALNAINVIIGFGIMNYGLKLEIPDNEICQQIVYNYFNDPEILSGPLRRRIKKYISEGSLIVNEARKGFTGSGHEIDPDALEGLDELLMKDEVFYRLAEDNCRLLKAAKSLGLIIHDIYITIKHYRQAVKIKEEFEKEFGADAWTSVKKDLIFDVKNSFYDVGDNNSSLELFRLLAGVRSKIGKRNFCLMYKKEILNRMFGCKNDEAIKKLLANNEKIRNEYEFLSRRRQFDRLIKKAAERKLLTIQPNNRGYFVSIKYTSEELRQRTENKKAVLLRIIARAFRVVYEENNGTEYLITEKDYKAAAFFLEKAKERETELLNWSKEEVFKYFEKAFNYYFRRAKDKNLTLSYLQDHYSELNKNSINEKEENPDSKG